MVHWHEICAEDDQPQKLKYEPISVCSNSMKNITSGLGDILQPATPGIVWYITSYHISHTPRWYFDVLAGTARWRESSHRPIIGVYMALYFRSRGSHNWGFLSSLQQARLLYQSPADHYDIEHVVGKGRRNSRMSCPLHGRDLSGQGKKKQVQTTAEVFGGNRPQQHYIFSNSMFWLHLCTTNGCRRYRQASIASIFNGSNGSKVLSAEFDYKVVLAFMRNYECSVKFLFTQAHDCIITTINGVKSHNHAQFGLHSLCTCEAVLLQSWN